MGEGFQFLDIILLAMVAAFIVLRLRSVLGRRTGHHQPRPPTPVAAPREGREREEETVIALPDLGRSETAAGMAAETGGLTRIKLADPQFDTAQFIDGAKAAYEMIVTAFAAGDKASLRPLLNEDVYGNFVQAIDDRRRQGHTLETTLAGIKKADIVEADLKNQTAEITVRFVSDLVNVTRDAQGNVVAGNADAVEEVTDIWTFSRDTGSRDPNWLLIATSVSV